ncbi:nucleoid-associated protein YgaU [Methylopila capsulata]|uniref:Nucleoid-associated protein YgaU n=1 Tax=Methylopila capsulata TaxID=61654 RepID=A0ABS2T2I6_9HYPH|nr:LysM peptidoglycan-binding domain-containing protein [Methylopila capsulata]MBM7850394.1 nucleoid-associated protein YgaU [Methylopila capsulata]
MKRGFAAGFVLVAAAVGVYGCQRASSPTAPNRQAEAPAAPDAAPAPGAPSAALKPQPGSPSAAPKDTDVPTLAAPSGGTAAAPSPAAPATRAPADPAKPSFDVVRVEPSGEMVVAGRCVANCAVALTANGRTHESAKADAQGQFTMTPAPLAPGDYQIGLAVTQPDGKTIVSDQTLTVSVPKPPSKDVVVVLNKPGAPSQILQRPEGTPTDPKVAGAADAAGQSAFAPAAASSAAAPESARAAAGGKLAIVAVETENGRFFAQGSGPADGRLRLYLNNAPVASATIGGDGRWSLRVERGLAPGSYVVRADQLDPKSAEVVARAEATFTYAVAPLASAATADESSGAQAPAGAAAGAAASDAPRTAAATPAPAASDAANPVVGAIGAVKVERGDSLWRISRSNYGAGARYTVIYQANDGQIRNPNLIYPGQVFVLPNESADGQTPPARP